MLNKLFGFNPKQHNVKTELIAGITTFLTMAYILAVAPNVLSAAGMDRGAVFTTTAVISGLATMLMAVYGKLPFVLAPGIGLLSFFTYTVCMTLGYTWQFALTAVFIEGVIFILLTITNLREMILYSLPETIRNSIGCGIGLFIAFLGLQNSGIVVNSDATLVSIGNVTSGPALLCLIGLIISAILLVKNVTGALLYGIIITTLIGIPMGVTKLDGFFSIPPSMEPILFKFEWTHILTKDMIVVVFTFLFVDIFDTIGTLIGVSARANMIDKDGKIPWLKKAFMVDAIATTVGAMMGSSTTTTYVESSAGVGAGGRTGLTAFAAAVCFLISLFLAPFFLSIPSAAVAPALIIVGLMMMASVSKINFTDYSEAVPAFICIIMMPLTYSISNGIVLGLLSYVLINLFSGNRKKLTIGTYVLSAIFVLKFII